MTIGRFDNAWQGTVTVSGSGNTATRITKAQFEAETGETAPATMGTHALRCSIVQAATILFTLPALVGGPIDLTSAFYKNVCLRYYIKQKHLNRLTNTTFEFRLNTNASNLRFLKDRQKNLGRCVAGFNDLAIPRTVLVDASPSTNFTVFDADVGTYNPASVANFSCRIFGDTGATAGVDLYLLDIVHNDLEPTPRVFWTWDDGDDTQYDLMWPLAQTYNIPGELFPVATSVNNAGSMTAAEIQEMIASGLYETGLHGLNLANHLATEGYNDLTAAEVLIDIDDQKSAMTNKAIATQRARKIIACPLGQHYQTTDGTPIDPLIFGSGIEAFRGTSDSFFAPNFFTRNNLPWIPLGQGAGFITDVADYIAVADLALNAGLNLIVVGHKIVTSSPTGNNVVDTDLEAMFEEARDRHQAGTQLLTILSRYLHGRGTISRSVPRGNIVRNVVSDPMVT